MLPPLILALSHLLDRCVLVGCCARCCRVQWGINLSLPLPSLPACPFHTTQATPSLGSWDPPTYKCTVYLYEVCVLCWCRVLRCLWWSWRKGRWGAAPLLEESSQGQGHVSAGGQEAGVPRLKACLWDMEQGPPGLPRQAPSSTQGRCQSLKSCKSAISSLYRVTYLLDCLLCPALCWLWITIPDRRCWNMVFFNTTLNPY